MSPANHLKIAQDHLKKVIGLNCIGGSHLKELQLMVSWLDDCRLCLAPYVEHMDFTVEPVTDELPF